GPSTAARRQNRTLHFGRFEKARRFGLFTTSGSQGSDGSKSGTRCCTRCFVIHRGPRSGTTRRPRPHHLGHVDSTLPRDRKKTRPLLSQVVMQSRIPTGGTARVHLQRGRPFG